tara:strand:+ start:532 stop:699 length:168 start_codon:yes stop_codon:yes gene_type:complete
MKNIKIFIIGVVIGFLMGCSTTEKVELPEGHLLLLKNNTAEKSSTMEDYGIKEDC